MSARIKLADIAATQALAEQVAPLLQVGDCLLLYGDVGLGKTSFTRFLIGAMQHKPEEVTSPTFTLVQPYRVSLANGALINLHHYDLYRLESPAELEELGFEESVETGIAVVEWPEKALDYLPKDAVKISFEAGPCEQAREIHIEAPDDWSDRMQLLLEGWKSHAA